MTREYLKKILKKSFLWRFISSVKYKYPNIKPKYSYSQLGEDLILDFFLKGKGSGFYVDVGAYHPINLSNTYKFYKRGWSGINIEPNYTKFRLFEEQRSKDINLNIGIGGASLKAQFFVFDADARLLARQQPGRVWFQCRQPHSRAYQDE